MTQVVCGQFVSYVENIEQYKIGYDLDLLGLNLFQSSLYEHSNSSLLVDCSKLVRLLIVILCGYKKVLLHFKGSVLNRAATSF